MSKLHPLSREQIEMLQNSPHVLYVRETTINYSAKFKEHVYHEYRAGKTYETILREAGIDPDILGLRRINSLRNMVRIERKRETGFTDRNNRLPAGTLSIGGVKTNTGETARIEHELAYVKQELEFLKKNYLAEMETQKACDMKRHRKSNSKSSAI